MHPAAGDEIQWSAYWSIGAELNLDIMIASHALILATTEGVEVLAVEVAQNTGDILPIVIYGMSDSVRSRDSRDGKFRGRNSEALIDVHLGARRMVHCHQIQIVVVIGFPQFRCKPKIVITIMRTELVWTDFVPFFRGFHPCRTDGVDPEPYRRTPRNCILHKFHLLAVVSEQERAGTLQTLLGHNFLIAFQIEFGTDRAVRPDDSRHIEMSLIAEPKVKKRSGDRLL